MKKILFGKLLLIISLFFLLIGGLDASAKTSFANKWEREVNDKDSVHLVVDQMPEFQGGRRGLAAYINQNLKYPEEAKRLNVKGKVYVKFVVGASGKVKDVHLVRKGNPILDAEAIRIVKLMPNWKPGKHKGQVVNVAQIVTISFPPKR